MGRFSAPQTLQALRSLPLSQSITWQPLDLFMNGLHEQSSAQEVCAALIGTPFAQAVSKLRLADWSIEPPIAALRASFPNVLHFELDDCPQSMASSLSVAIAVWPMLQSISISLSFLDFLEEAQALLQHLEAAARTAAELKAGQPFEIVLRVDDLREGDASLLDAQVAAVWRAGGGKVPVHWEPLCP